MGKDTYKANKAEMRASWEKLSSIHGMEYLLHEIGYNNLPKHDVKRFYDIMDTLHGLVRNVGEVIKMHEEATKAELSKVTVADIDRNIHRIIFEATTIKLDELIEFVEKADRIGVTSSEIDGARVLLTNFKDCIPAECHTPWDGGHVPKTVALEANLYPFIQKIANVGYFDYETVLEFDAMARVDTTKAAAIFAKDWDIKSVSIHGQKYYMWSN